MFSRYRHPRTSQDAVPLRPTTDFRVLLFTKIPMFQQSRLQISQCAAELILNESLLKQTNKNHWKSTVSSHSDLRQYSPMAQQTKEAKMLQVGSGLKTGPAGSSFETCLYYKGMRFRKGASLGKIYEWLWACRMTQEGMPSSLLASHKNNKDPWWPLAQFCKLCTMNGILTGSLLSIFSSFLPFICSIFLFFLHFSRMSFSFLFSPLLLVWKVRTIGN